MRKVNIGDTVTLPVHMDKGPEMMKGTVVGLYPTFYRVQFVTDANRNKSVFESYAYYGGLR